MNAAQIHSAIHKASHETSRIASKHIQSEAHNSGWPEHLSKSLHVVYDKDGFNVHTHEDHVSETLDHEYGTPGRQPNAALRRSANKTREVENFFVNRLFSHLEDSL